MSHHFKSGGFFFWEKERTNAEMTVSGCSIPFDIEEPSPETGTSTVVNTEIVKWNNEIRGAMNT